MDCESTERDATAWPRWGAPGRELPPNSAHNGTAVGYTASLDQEHQLDTRHPTAIFPIQYIERSLIGDEHDIVIRRRLDELADVVDDVVLLPCSKVCRAIRRGGLDLPHDNLP